MDAADVMRWHDWWRDAWTEQRPVPVEMTKAEAFEWIAENADKIVWHKRTDMYPGQWEIICPDIPMRVKAKTLLGAACLARAYFDETIKG